jgi:ribosome-associated translation inhibitor RaiA
MRRGAPLVAKDRARSFSATIDQLIEKIEKQLKKAKEKRKDHKGAERRSSRSAAKGNGGRDEETYEDVVRKSLKG